jgi:hypothetical protein
MRQLAPSVEQCTFGHFSTAMDEPFDLTGPQPALRVYLAHQEGHISADVCADKDNKDDEAGEVTWTSSVLVLAHHIVCDATSLLMFAKDMWASYDNQTIEEDPTPLSDRPTDPTAVPRPRTFLKTDAKSETAADVWFFDYAQNHAAGANKATSKRQLDYWRRQLEGTGGGFKPLKLRYDLNPIATAGKCDTFVTPCSRCSSQV